MRGGIASVPTTGIPTRPAKGSARRRSERRLRDRNETGRPQAPRPIRSGPARSRPGLFHLEFDLVDGVPVDQAAFQFALSAGAFEATDDRAARPFVVDQGDAFVAGPGELGEGEVTTRAAGFDRHFGSRRFAVALDRHRATADD